MALVSLHAVSKYFGAQRVLSHLNLKMEPGEKIGLIGANGSGKTTLLRLIIGSEESTEGRIIRGKI